MNLSLNQAAERLGKTRRQIRYLIQQGKLPARKDGGRWVVDAADLPLSAAQQAAGARRDAELRDAADRALGPRRPPWSLKDLKAIQLGAPIYQDCRARLGAEAEATQALRAALDALATALRSG